MAYCTKRESLNRNLSIAIATTVGGALGFLIAYAAARGQGSAFFALAATGISILLGWLIFRYLTRKYRRRAAEIKKPFPAEWRKHLEHYVQYYVQLSPEKKVDFEQRVQIFLLEHTIVGIKTEVDDLTRVLTAASATIPVFGFPEWEYYGLGEILIYPNSFNAEYGIHEETDRNIAGMVGNNYLFNVMILSKPDLIRGFAKPEDEHNVGVHEFVHLVDKADGEIDGVPSAYLDRKYIEPWIQLMDKEIAAIRAGESDIKEYGGTNRQEFFAVASEYFFENPEGLKQDHPEVYNLLEKVFRQNTYTLLKDAVSEMIGSRFSRVGANSPCPCESGEKFKNCCKQTA